jgi:hypothetical protein
VLPRAREDVEENAGEAAVGEVGPPSDRLAVYARRLVELPLAGRGKRVRNLKQRFLNP